jgi:hypothetical protein
MSKISSHDPFEYFNLKYFCDAEISQFGEFYFLETEISQYFIIGN